MQILKNEVVLRVFKIILKNENLHYLVIYHVYLHIHDRINQK